jgi:hypothetical protein
LAAQLGPAVTATARKLAILVYRTLKDHLVYADPGADVYDAQHRTHVLRRLRQRANNLGFGLINLSTGEIIEAAVSSEARVTPANSPTSCSGRKICPSA